MAAPSKSWRSVSTALTFLSAEPHQDPFALRHVLINTLVFEDESLNEKAVAAVEKQIHGEQAHDPPTNTAIDESKYA